MNYDCSIYDDTGDLLYSVVGFDDTNRLDWSSTPGANHSFGVYDKTHTGGQRYIDEGAFYVGNLTAAQCEALVNNGKGRVLTP